MTVVERLQAKSIPVTESGCWVWMDHTERAGYGMIWCNGKKVLAHRLSYETFIGPIPAGMSLECGRRHFNAWYARQK